MWEHVLLWTLGNQPTAAWSGGVEPAQTPQLALLAAFPRPLSRCHPLLYRPPVLCLLCADGTCSAQWTICVLSLHLLPTCKEIQGKVDVHGDHRHKLPCCQDVIVTLSQEQ
jgi:hypothetical protein